MRANLGEKEDGSSTRYEKRYASCKEGVGCERMVRLAEKERDAQDSYGVGIGDGASLGRGRSGVGRRAVQREELRS